VSGRKYRHVGLIGGKDNHLHKTIETKRNMYAKKAQDRLSSALKEGVAQSTRKVGTARFALKG